MPLSNFTACHLSTLRILVRTSDIGLVENLEYPAILRCFFGDWNPGKKLDVLNSSTTVTVNEMKTDFYCPTFLASSM